MHKSDPYGEWSHTLSCKPEFLGELTGIINSYKHKEHYCHRETGLELADVEKVRHDQWVHSTS